MKLRKRDGPSSHDVNASTVAYQKRAVALDGVVLEQRYCGNDLEAQTELWGRSLAGAGAALQSPTSSSDSPDEEALSSKNT